MITRSEKEQGGYNRSYPNQPKGDGLVPTSSISDRFRSIIRKNERD
jgi:hypothetical protein